MLVILSGRAIVGECFKY